MGGLAINGLKFLSTISLHIYVNTMHYMPNITARYYQRALNELNSVYKRGGFDLTKIRCDREFQAALDSIVAKINPPIKVNYANTQEHVLQAERNNWCIKEHFIPVHHRLLFDQLPRKMVQYLGLESARKTNIFPEKHGVPKYYSPRMIVCQENVDYEKHLKITFGTHVLVNKKTKTHEYECTKKFGLLISEIYR